MASAIILLPFYIIYLPTDVYGALAISLAIAAIIQIITTYSFDSSLYIHYHEFFEDKPKLNSFISSAFIFMLSLGLAVGVLLSFSGQFLLMTILPKSAITFYPYGFVAVGLGIFQAIFKVYGNLLQIREKPEVFFWSNIFSFLLIATSTIVGLKLFPGTLIGPLGGRLLAAFLSAIWALFRVFREYGFHFKSPWQSTSFSFNVYTFIYQLQQWIVNYIDRFIILFFMPSAAIATVGVYDFALKCLAPIELLLNGLNASIFPQVIKLFNKQAKIKSSSIEINRYFYGQVSLIMVGICLSIIFLPWIVGFFVHGSNYNKSLEYVPYLAVIFIFRTTRLYFVLPYNILKKMQTLTILNFFVSAIKIILMIWLIINWQIIGVIISSAISYLIEMFLLWHYLKKDYHMKFNMYKLIIAPFFLLLVIVMVEPWGVFPIFAHVGYAFLCAILLWFSYRNEIRLMSPTKLFKLK